MAAYVIRTVGDAAISVEFDNIIAPEVNAKVHGLASGLVEANVPGIIDTVPTFRSLLICYNPLKIGYNKLCSEVEKIIAAESKAEKREAHTYLIPVCYGGLYGEDLSFVAKHTGLTEDEVIRRHSAIDYQIYMLGFLPGFSYLGGMDESLVTPRLPQPRQKIPAGSVGIGGNQTGMYPLDSPGGWRLIGRSPVKPYDIRRENPILYSAGDFIRFVPIDVSEYEKIAAEVEAETYVYKVLKREVRK